MMIIVAFEELLINMMANIGGDVIDSMGRESEVTFIITRRRPGERERASASTPPNDYAVRVSNHRQLCQLS